MIFCCLSRVRLRGAWRTDLRARFSAPHFGPTLRNVPDIIRLRERRCCFQCAVVQVRKREASECAPLRPAQLVRAPLCRFLLRVSNPLRLFILPRPSHKCGFAPPCIQCNEFKRIRPSSLLRDLADLRRAPTDTTMRPARRHWRHL